LKKNLAKNVTIILLIGMFIVGAVGSFVAISLIASIGANSAVKKVKEAKDV
jgi:amino acid transporter